MTRRYLSRTEVAERIGVKPDTLGRYLLPAPDALIGGTRGWLPATIDEWNASRPGRGGAVGGLRPC
jgi:predicted DNA-binding transcriptional regulator AlpA